ncbi:DUF2145 domain-containing protein [Alkalisalibacterium limincola]|uniref:DUF2145 domain-containing protein n=1 Tax=Alkalisalibacterium limincola TaxID=2699169 RepID=A0A5C8KUW5_9GAMM|nr:DUF2145 domain-containing protein [Alkalisalibacterium limincola]TXK65754.1 DUF2145 domain-containing protein [Alkalisalibacterium limincola]
MSRRLKCLLAGALVSLHLWAGAAQAGGNCDADPVSPLQLAAAAETAVRVAAALDQADAPVALVSRVGADLSRHGLVYSHAGFAVRDHPRGRWSVVHLLNECRSTHSGLYVQGLVNFFSDDLVNQDARITWLEPDLARRLASHLAGPSATTLHHPRYNVIARPGSRDYQNSTLWMVEVLATQLADYPGPVDRDAAIAHAEAMGFEPDRIRIAYTRRVLGGLFSTNAVFTDHPVATRVSGSYPVATVRSILAWLASTGNITSELEWWAGVLQHAGGPG